MNAHVSLKVATIHHLRGKNPEKLAFFRLIVLSKYGEVRPN